LLFVSHDLRAVHHISDRIAVMYLGQIVELGRAEEIYARPLMPYTRALIAVAPSTRPRSNGRSAILTGEVPDASQVPPGCRFHPRCPHAIEMCRTQVPPWEEISPKHFVACHRARELQLAGVE
jgi:oligopeptide/dipeptide ABC transporter ATP-binding protein